MSFPIHARFTHPDAGYQGDQDLAAKHLTVGRVYVLDALIVSRSSSEIRLHDFPGVQFNSVMFDPAEQAFADDWEPAS
jgi:hypothetical protein